MAEEKEEEGWRTDDPPENVRLLVEWGHAESGPAGYDVAHFVGGRWKSRINGADVEVGDFVVFGWRRLPPFSKRRKKRGKKKS